MTFIQPDYLRHGNKMIKIKMCFQADSGYRCWPMESFSGQSAGMT